MINQNTISLILYGAALGAAVIGLIIQQGIFTDGVSDYSTFLTRYRWNNSLNSLIFVLLVGGAFFSDRHSKHYSWVTFTQWEFLTIGVVTVLANIFGFADRIFFHVLFGICILWILLFIIQRIRLIEK